MPRVSAIMGVLNGERYVAAAVNSILNQTFRDLELIVVDDGSTDGTAGILRGLTDNRIQILRNRKNLGHAPSLNKAIAIARGEYIARQDADDISMPERFARQVSYLDEKGDVALLGAGCTVIDENNTVIGAWSMPTADIDIRWSLLFYNPVINSSVMVRRSVVTQLGNYSEDPDIVTAFVEDYDLWSRIAEKCKVANLEEQLIDYRSHSQSASHLTLHKQNAQRDKIAQRNIASVVGAKELDQRLWRGMRMFLHSQISERVCLSIDDVRLVVSFLDKLMVSFHRKHEFANDAMMAHRRRQYRIWARRCFSLSYKNNIDKTSSTRSALLKLAALLLLRTALPSLVMSV